MPLHFRRHFVTFAIVFFVDCLCGELEGVLALFFIALAGNNGLYRGHVVVVCVVSLTQARVI